MMRLLNKKNIARSMALVLAGCLLFGGAVYADDNPAATGEEETAVESKFLKDKFGSIELYRWEKLTGDVSSWQDRVNEWTPVMLVANGSYIGSDELLTSLYGSGYYSDKDRNDNLPFLATDITEIKTTDWINKNINTDKVAYGGALTKKDGVYQYLGYGSYYLKINDDAYNYKNKDTMIHADRDLFYTDDDRGCPSLRYHGSNGEVGPFFALRTRKAEKSAKAKTYYYRPGSVDNGHSTNADNVHGILSFSEDMSESFVVQKNSESDTYKLGDRYTYSNTSYNHEINLRLTDDIVYAERNEATWFTVFVGELHHFSSLKGDTQINSGQVLSVSEADYIGADGPEEDDGKGSHTMGCFVPNGATITVNKGGVLSISGNLLNNGTIVNNGGTIIIRNGGSISSFMAGKDIANNGCGSIKCNNGDIIIEKGGAIYAGMNDAACQIVPFYLDNSSTLINCGLLVYGSLRLGENARVECREGSKTVGKCFGAKGEQDVLCYTLKNTRNKTEAPTAVINEYKNQGYTVTSVKTGTRETTVYVYKKDLGENDTDFDLLPYYNDKILNAKSGIPDDCLGLYKQDNYGGMYMSESAKKSIVLKYPNATIEDKTAEDAKLISEKKGL